MRLFEPAHEIMVLITSKRRPAKAQASLRIRAVSPEPSLFAHNKYGSRRRVRLKIRHLAPCMAAHVRLKNEFTEGEKYHNLMRCMVYLKGQKSIISVTR